MSLSRVPLLLLIGSGGGGGRLNCVAECCGERGDDGRGGGPELPFGMKVAAQSSYSSSSGSSLMHQKKEISIMKVIICISHVDIAVHHFVCVFVQRLHLCIYMHMFDNNINKVIMVA